MQTPWRPLLDLTADAARLGFESSAVIGLRVALAVRGDAGAVAEFTRMFSEKAQAAIDAHFLVAGSVMGGEAHLAPARAVALYRQRVQANHSRLTFAA